MNDQPTLDKSGNGWRLQRKGFKRIMNNQTTYALLVHSKEKARDRLEIAVYVMCVLSAIGAIWQFAWQPNPPPFGEISWQSYAPPHVSHHQTGGFWFGKS
jgi:hypothetical protein